MLSEFERGCKSLAGHLSRRPFPLVVFSESFSLVRPPLGAFPGLIGRRMADPRQRSLSVGLEEAWAAAERVVRCVLRVLFCVQLLVESPSRTGSALSRSSRGPENRTRNASPVFPPGSLRLGLRYRPVQPSERTGAIAGSPLRVRPETHSAEGRAGSREERPPGSLRICLLCGAEDRQGRVRGLARAAGDSTGR